MLYTAFRLPPLKVSSQIKGLPFPPPILVILQELLPIIILSGTLISVGQTILEVLSFCSIFVIRKFVASFSILMQSKVTVYVFPLLENSNVPPLAFPKFTTIITLRIRSAASIIIDAICFSFLKFVFIMKSPFVIKCIFLILFSFLYCILIILTLHHHYLPKFFSLLLSFFHLHLHKIHQRNLVAVWQITHKP